MIKKILIIDDEEDFSKLVKKNLELTGEFEVSTAINGNQGLTLVKKTKPDLILLDIMMPGIDGFKVLETLKANMDTIDIPVIMLTAKGDDPSKIRSSQLYDDEYINKPIGAADLKAKILEVFRRRGIQ